MNFLEFAAGSPSPPLRGPSPAGRGRWKQSHIEHEEDSVLSRFFFTVLLVDAPSPGGRGWREAPGEGLPLRDEHGARALVFPGSMAKLLMLRNVQEA